MAFADTQMRKLRSKLKPAHIKTREADGISLHYLEGWHVMAEANRIFGFDGWDRESVASLRVDQADRSTLCRRLCDAGAHHRQGGGGAHCAGGFRGG